MDNQNTNQTGVSSAEGGNPSGQGGVGQNKLMGVLSYLGILVIIPFLVAKEDPFVKFHIKQGLILVVIELAVWIIGMFVYAFSVFANLINLGVFILAIVGIVNVIQGKEKELPLVGSLSKYFRF